MTLKEILKAQGLTDEQIVAVEAAMKENKVFTAGEENLDIRYGKLKTEYDSLSAQHGEATKALEELKKANKGNEALQGRIVEYETQIQGLQAELQKARTDAAIKVALLEAKGLDIDYLTFKLREKGELELDENGNIKGLDDKIAGLKTQFPTQFEGSADKKIDPNKLSGGNPSELTAKDIARMPYGERAKLFQENPEAFTEATKK